MPCALSQGYALDCRDSFGGVKQVYLAKYEDISGVTLTAGIVTALTKATGKRFYKYELVVATSSAEQSLTANRANGTTEIKQTVKFPINKMSTAVRNELMALAAVRVLVVVEDQNGYFWLFGKDFGLTLAATTANTGTSLTDRNGFEISFEGMEKSLAFEVNAAVAGALETVG
jgi:hypothetical protein